MGASLTRRIIFNLIIVIGCFVAMLYCISQIIDLAKPSLSSNSKIEKKYKYDYFTIRISTTDYNKYGNRLPKNNLNHYSLLYLFVMLILLQLILMMKSIIENKIQLLKLIEISIPNIRKFQPD